MAVFYWMLSKDWKWNSHFEPKPSDFYRHYFTSVGGGGESPWEVFSNEMWGEHMESVSVDGVHDTLSTLPAVWQGEMSFLFPDHLVQQTIQTRLSSTASAQVQLLMWIPVN